MPGWLIRNATWIKFADRTILGIVLVMVGAWKLAPGTAEAYVAMIRANGTSPWVNLWVSIAQANPVLFIAVVGGLEVTIGLCTFLGLLRKPAFVLGMGMGLWLWLVPEGFEGFLGPGRLETSAGLFVSLGYLSLMLLEATFGIDKLALDRLIAERWKRWLVLTDFYGLVEPLQPAPMSVALLPILQREKEFLRGGQGPPTSTSMRRVKRRP